MSNQTIIDIPKNACNITTVEAEFDRAMAADAEDERKDPVGHAIRSLRGKWESKSNRFNSCYSYGDLLAFYMNQSYWPEIKAIIENENLPTLAEFTTAYKRYIWKFRLELVNEKPKLASTREWYPEYLANKDKLIQFCAAQ